MTSETPTSAIGETALSSEPAAARSASIVERHRLGFAQTAASGPGSFVSGATQRSDGKAPFVGPMPARIGRYMVIRPLGAGGMGVVVEAYDPELDRKVAIKLLKGRSREDSQARLLREAQAMARVSHANVVQVYDVGMVDDQVFIAMELIRGKTLADLLEASRPGWREVVALFVDAGRGLAAAHAVGLVHRDFKPDNVLIADDGRVCVADFGLAREEPRGPAEGEDDGPADNPGERPLVANTLTATGVLMGTPMYMSPEQHRAEPAGPASDIFSFSVALWEGLYGKRPFAGDTLPQLSRAILGGKLSEPPAGHGIPGWLDAVVRRGLQVRPEDRFASFDELLRALGRDPARARRRWLGLSGLALGAALTGGAITASGGAPERCTGGGEVIAAVWSDARADALRGRLAALPQPLRAASEERTIAALAGYADGWAALHRSACLGNAAGERSDALLDAQMRCLDDRKEALAGAIEVIEAGDEATLREATTVVATLPPLAACDDADALLAAVPPPSDPATRAAAEALRHRLVRAEVEVHAGHHDLALARAAAVRAESEALGYRPLVAEAALAQGRIAAISLRWAEANAALGDAFVLATAAGDDAAAAEARARLVFTAQAPPSPAERAHAEALVARLRGRGDLDALLRNNLGVVLLAAGDRDGAHQLFADAWALAAEDPRVDPIERTSGYLRNLALTTDDADERARLFDRAEAELSERLGADHLTTLTLRWTRSEATDDLARAAAIRGETCPKIQELYSRNYETCALCFYNLAHDLDELGERARAASAAEAIDACLAVPIVAEDQAPMAAWRALGRGYARLFAGDPAAARGQFAEASALYSPHAELPWIAPLLGDAQLGEGRSLLALGEPRAASAPLSAAIGTLEPIAPLSPQKLPLATLARARASLASALADPGGATEPGAQGDPAASAGPPAADEARAHALIDAAVAYYEGAGSGRQARLAELREWRSAHPRR